MDLSVPHQSAENLKGPLGYSVVFHVILFGALISSTVFSHHGEVWGGAGGEGTINVNLVGNIPAIPLPKPDVVTTNRVVDNTKGLYTDRAAAERITDAGPAKSAAAGRQERDLFAEVR